MNRTMLVGLMAALFMILSACAPQTGQAGNQAETVDEPAVVKGVLVARSSPPPAASDEVDFSCESDQECSIKDIGSCCGYRPACVNVDSPTFPEQVAARCAEEGLSGICGFPSISGCQCIEGRCEGIQTPAEGSNGIR